MAIPSRPDAPNNDPEDINICNRLLQYVSFGDDLDWVGAIRLSRTLLGILYHTMRVLIKLRELPPRR